MCCDFSCRSAVDMEFPHHDSRSSAFFPSAAVYMRGKIYISLYSSPAIKLLCHTTLQFSWEWKDFVWLSVAGSSTFKCNSPSMSSSWLFATVELKENAIWLSILIASPQTFFNWKNLEWWICAVAARGVIESKPQSYFSVTRMSFDWNSSAVELMFCNSALSRGFEVWSNVSMEVEIFVSHVKLLKRKNRILMRGKKDESFASNKRIDLSSALKVVSVIWINSKALNVKLL